VLAQLGRRGDLARPSLDQRRTWPDCGSTPSTVARRKQALAHRQAHQADSGKAQRR
jgi:hypothetical protein